MKERSINMNDLVLLNYEEVTDVNGGGILSAVAGTIAGGMIGMFAGLIPAVVAKDPSIIVKTTITVASGGLWVGLGCPLP